MKLNIYLLTLLTVLGSLQLFAAGSEEELPQPDQWNMDQEPVPPLAEEEVLPIDETKEAAELRLLNEFRERLHAIYATFTQHSAQLQRFLDGDERRRKDNLLSYERVICTIFMLDFAGLYDELLQKSGANLHFMTKTPFFENIIKIIAEVLGMRLEDIQAAVNESQKSLFGDLIRIQTDYFFTFIKQLFRRCGYEMLTCETFASALPFVSYQDCSSTGNSDDLNYFFTFLIDAYERFKNIDWASLCIGNSYWDDNPNVPALVFNFLNGNEIYRCNFFYRIQFLLLKGASLEAALGADKAFLSKVLQRILKVDWMRKDHFFRILQLLLERNSDGIDGDCKLNNPYQDDALTLFEYAIEDDWPLDIIDLMLMRGCNYQLAFCNSTYDGLLGKLLSKSILARWYWRKMFSTVLQIHFKKFLLQKKESIEISHKDLEDFVNFMNPPIQQGASPWGKNFCEWFWKLNSKEMIFILLSIDFYSCDLINELMILLAPYDQVSQKKILEAIEKALNKKNSNMLTIEDNPQPPQNQTVLSGHFPDDDDSGGRVMLHEYFESF